MFDTKCLEKTGTLKTTNDKLVLQFLVKPQAKKTVLSTVMLAVFVIEHTCEQSQTPCVLIF